ncbi:MAG: hypothetical protein HWD59_00370 [Coxiellaceae bacterium]|nr:MAG: hypothetical protein HWD59_00370 [Coxiellaceae bacterium]
MAAYLFKSSHDPAIIENLVKHYTNTQGIIDIDGLCSIISTGFIDAIRNAAISLQKHQ